MVPGFVREKGSGVQRVLLSSSLSDISEAARASADSISGLHRVSHHSGPNSAGGIGVMETGLSTTYKQRKCTRLGFLASAKVIAEPIM